MSERVCLFDGAELMKNRLVIQYSEFPQSMHQLSSGRSLSKIDKCETIPSSSPFRVESLDQTKVCWASYFPVFLPPFWLSISDAYRWSMWTMILCSNRPKPFDFIYSPNIERFWRTQLANSSRSFPGAIIVCGSEISCRIDDRPSWSRKTSLSGKRFQNGK